MIDALREIAVWILLLTGSSFAIVGGIGLLRLPDLFSRMHGSGITDTLGAGSILAGLRHCRLTQRPHYFPALLSTLPICRAVMFLSWRRVLLRGG